MVWFSPDLGARGLVEEVVEHVFGLRVDHPGAVLLVEVQVGVEGQLDVGVLQSF